jgi:hypothetical protein
MSTISHARLAPEEEWHCVTPVPIPPDRARRSSVVPIALAIVSVVVALVVVMALRGTS